YEKFGLNDLEQLEDAPEYKPGVVLTAEMVAEFINGKVKQPA
ncbi:MAG: cupin protein, partial [Herminiimonas sp.]|nr:cupin protein [Herminiimonas sp.]MDB5764390.1 cupin protein [Herminiimonas sp.]MDB5765022.1 cupin protein [Herminiimonas sp.]